MQKSKWWLPSNGGTLDPSFNPFLSFLRIQKFDKYSEVIMNCTPLPRREKVGVEPATMRCDPLEEQDTASIDTYTYPHTDTTEACLLLGQEGTNQQE